MPSSAFVVGQWVRGAKFYGRAALIDEILEGPRNSIWLLGTRRIGKTSVLKQVEYLTADPEHSGFLPLFWDFQGAEDLSELHEGFTDALWDSEERLERLGIKPGELEGLELFEGIGRLRRRLRAKDKRLLLLCDEVEELINLSQKNPSLLRKLRHIMQSHEGIRCVIASTIRLWALAEQRGDTSPFLHGFTPPLYIHRLGDDEARTLIRQGNLPSESRPRFTDEAEETIRTKCDNHPYLIQLVCKRFQELGNLDEAIEEVAADSMVNYFFAVDFEMLSAPERSVIRVIAETSAASSDTIHGRVGVEGDSLSGSLLQLEHLGYVRRNAKRRFELANFFFRRWFSSPTQSRNTHGVVMDADRYEQITRLFLKICEVEPGERSRLLDEACGDDAELRAEVESLLAHDEQPHSDLARRTGDSAGSREASAEDPTQWDSEIGPGLFDDRYNLLKRAGEGAAGVVYKAHDAVLDEVMAIKILRSAFSSHPDTLERFRQEILLARDIVHPNILKIYHFGDCEGRKYLTMKWISGPTLAQLLSDEAPLSIERSVELAKKLAAALEAAHGAKVIHRDIKPSNILMDDGGELFLSDFGLGRLLDAPSTTRSGVFLGTPHYASPEQARLLPSDERSDVYAFGLVLFEMLTAKRPFSGDSTAEVLEMHRNATPPDPRETRTDIPPDLSDLIVRCLQKNPRDRFRNGGRLRSALEDLRIGPSR